MDIRSYRVLYEVSDDIKKALEGMLAPEERIEARGQAEVREVFSISKLGKIAGCFVRDGVINRERADYVKSWKEFEFLPGALEAIRKLSELPPPIVVVTNQSAVGRGIIDRSVVDQIHTQMHSEIRSAGGRVDHIAICPHSPAERCACRKPGILNFTRSAERLGASLENSWFVGDAITDYQAATRAGCASVMVRTGRQGRQLDDLLPPAHGAAVVADIGAAVDHIVRCETSA